MIKKCRDCGGDYETEDKPLTLNINHKDIENLEDLIFVDLTEKEFLRRRQTFRKIWKQLCDGEEKWDKQNG